MLVNYEANQLVNAGYRMPPWVSYLFILGIMTTFLGRLCTCHPVLVSGIIIEMVAGQNSQPFISLNENRLSNNIEKKLQRRGCINVAQLYSFDYIAYAWWCCFTS